LENPEAGLPGNLDMEMLAGRPLALGCFMVRTPAAPGAAGCISWAGEEGGECAEICLFSCLWDCGRMEETGDKSEFLGGNENGSMELWRV